MTTGDVLLADLSPVKGREQGGRRPVVVMSDRHYAVIPSLFLGVPLTTTQRGLRHHVPVPANSTTGLDRVSYAMPEQIRALSPRRVERHLGKVDESTIQSISEYLHLFIA